MRITRRRSAAFPRLGLDHVCDGRHDVRDPHGRAPVAGDGFVHG